MNKKHIKYLFFSTLLISSISLFSGISDKLEVDIAQKDNSLPETNDTVPLFPVKKTQIETYKDLNSNPPADLKDPDNIKKSIEYDPASGLYIFRTKIGDQEISTPFSLSPDEYMDYTLKQSMSRYFREKNAEAYDNKDEKEEFSLKDMKLDLGPAEKLFGPGGVKVRTQGYIEATMGIKYNKTDNPTLSERTKSHTTFQFKEDIQMNVTASVGDKINFGLNYDTKALFDFDSKKLKLGYEGKEDEIIKKIEAGNVSMSTTNSLINGGTALFGINAEMQFGKLRVNTVISQQESQSQTVNTKGGVQTTEFSFKADQYDENRHFFLGHYFRDNYNEAMSKVPYIKSPVSISKVEVWITNKRGDYTQSRNIVAFADIAERDVIKNPKWTGSGSVKAPYNNANTLYQTILNSYSGIRDISNVTGLFNNYLESGLDYEKIESARLLNPSDYTYNAQLGYISLNSALQADEVLAVAYQYTINGITYQAGELSTDISPSYDSGNPKSGALFLKLLKPVSLSPRSYTWDLMMKNVYYLGATNIQQDRFRFNISYQSDTLGTDINYLPEGNIKNQLLIKVTNLDRLNSQNKEVTQKDGTKGDGIFDYIEGYTVQSQNGRIFFPVVEPFGKHLANKIGSSIIAEKYVYQQLYDSTLTVARQIAEKNKFRMYGSYRGSSTGGSEIDLNATNIPQGSVKLTANGMQLTEGTDYIVDYTSGMVTIINQNLIDSDANIQTSLEERALGMQRKTMMGLNLSYDITKNFNIGGTIMHLYEKPLTTKTTIGDESVKNTLWGLNTSFKTESMWLTNLIDKIPFVDATQPSQISFMAEFAHMIPGHYQNKQTGGHSYLDDFESSESRIELKSPYAWTLAATPVDLPNPSYPTTITGSNTSDSINYAKNRAMLSWFSVDPLFTRRGSSLTPSYINSDSLSNHYIREVNIYEIYPNKDLKLTESATMPVLNLSYYPNERGPYNLDADHIDSDGKLLKPKQRWAGITRKMDVRDFEASNIEYIEFWLMDPFISGSKTTPKTPNKGGKLYFNLGEISEDVIKDGRKFYENGLPVNDDPTAYTKTIWGKVPTRQSTVYAFDDNQGDNARDKQDIGLNGLSRFEEQDYGIYKNFLTQFRTKVSQSVLNQMESDQLSPLNSPSQDTYHFYRGSDYDRDRKSILDRYKYYNGTEGNSRPTDQSGESYSTASRTTPDVEDIDQDNTLNENDSYFQYEVSLDPTKMDIGDNYIVDKREVTVELRNGVKEKVKWYQFKIPIREGEKAGKKNIQDFKSIRFMRMYLTDFEQPTFLRFGTLQLVRGDWRVYDQDLTNGTAMGNGSIDVSTVNIEENSERKPVNYVVPPGLSRSIDPDQTQITKENEQSLSMRIINLDPEDSRAIYKNTSYDFRRYKRIQLFTHAENLIDETDLKHGDLTVFMRLGSDYKNNFYEYEIPLAITPPGDYRDNLNDRTTVWPKENMFDFPLELLKDIKLNRNREKRKSGSSVSYTSLYHEYDPEKPNNKVSVMGNPSLSDVNVIMIGVRNNSRLTESGEVWINELRLTDFDEEGGWAAQGSLNIALSDLGTVSISGRKETAGFGALDQSLMERRQDDYHTYNISANVNLGRFLPEKAKISLPLYYSYSNQTTTPKYDPFDQDVTLKESLSLVDTRTEKDSIKSLAQEKSTTKSISLNNIKVNIQSKTPMPYDPANFDMGYSFNQTEIKNPSTVYDVTKNYNLTFGYNYTPLTKTWEPFKNTKSKSGAAKFAKSLGFNYLPNNVSFNSKITRYYNETLLRDIESFSLGGDNNSEFLSWSQSFLWDRDFNINWDLTKNLKIAFQSGTRAEIEEPYLQVNKKLNQGAYEIWKDSVMHSIKNLGTPLSYRQIAKVTYQLPFKNIPAMDWLTSNAGYTSGYQWDRGARIEGVEIGNTISNNVTFDFTNRINMVSLYNKWRFLERVNERFDSRKRQSPSQRQQEKKKPEKKRFSQNIELRKDTTYTLRHGLNTKSIQVIAKNAEGKSYAIKFKKKDENTILITNKDSVNIQVNVESKINEFGVPKLLAEIGDYSARGLMSLRNLNVNYSRRKETHISGFIPGVGNMFGQKDTNEYGLVPGLGFAFGAEGGEQFINKSLSRDWLVMDTMNVSPAVYSSAEKLELRAQLEPIKDLRIDLNANYENSKRTEIQYMSAGMPRTLGGNFSMTTIALKTALKSSNAKNNYQSDAFDNFLKYRETIKNRLQSQYDQANFQGNEVNLNSGDVLIPAFIAAYTGRDANNVSLSAFPSIWSMLPNWGITYDGLINIPFIKSKFKSLRLSHNYNSFYQVGGYSSFSGWTRIDGGGDDLGYIRDVLNGAHSPSSPYNISSVGITELFRPLIGAESVLNNSMNINAQYNNSRTLTLNMTSYQIIEYLDKEFVLGFGYRINEFNRVIGVTSRTPKNFNNDLNVKIDFSYKTTEALLRKIEDHFTQATNGLTIFTIKLSADYTLSRSLTLRAFYDRILNKPLISASSYPTTNSNFGLSLKFTLIQ